MLNVFIELNVCGDGTGMGMVLVDQKTKKKEIIEDYFFSPNKSFSDFLKLAVRCAVEYGCEQDDYIRIILSNEKECKIFDDKQIFHPGHNKHLKFIYVPLEQLKRNKYYREAEETALWISK